VNDEVVGVALLDDLHTPAELGIICAPFKTGGPKFPTWIPVKLRGDPDPTGTPSPWEIAIRGEFLDVRPSVKVSVGLGKDGMREIFHNGGNWTVRFARKSPALSPDSYEQLRQINPGIEYT
jgi:hypothetical protein